MTQSDISTFYRDVIIVGGGFAGIAAAKRLSRKGIDVLLIDKHNYHQFQPLLYQVATAQIGTSEVARSIRTIFRRDRRVRVFIDEVVAIDAAAKKVTLADGTVCTGRALVLAMGAEANFFGVDGAEEHSFPLYSLEDALALGAQIVAHLNGADSLTGAPRRLDLVVIGGGPTGVEIAGAVAENIDNAVAKIFSSEFSERIGVHLLDMGGDVLGPFSEKSRRYTHNRLEKLGVDMRFGVKVTRVHDGGVTLSDGTEVPGDMVVWAGGLKAPKLIAESGLPQGRGGRVDVDENLAVPGYHGVYVLGDSANITDAKGRHLPQLGSVAQQSGKWVARNIHADFAGEQPTPFKYLDKGIMAMVGRGAAVAELGPRRWSISGLPAFMSWLGVHVALLSGVWQRVGATASWTVDYLSPARPQVVLGRATRE